MSLWSFDSQTSQRVDRVESHCRQGFVFCQMGALCAVWADVASAALGANVPEP